jgi:hypothetical protein
MPGSFGELRIVSVQTNQQVKYKYWFQDIRKEYGHPHWLVLDEAHHLFPLHQDMETYPVPAVFNNFLLISVAPDAISPVILSKTGMLIVTGGNTHYPIEQFCDITHRPLPYPIPELSKEQACIWNIETGQPPYVIKTFLPDQLMQRHKKKYAAGDMSYNSFFFTDPENKLHLKANNLQMFKHIATGIDEDTWMHHLMRNDYSNWFKDCIHDKELASIGQAKKYTSDPAVSRKTILNYIDENYL